MPVVEDVIFMWMSYPHWERNQHLRRVVDLVFGIVVVSPYVADFVDDSQTALNSDTLLSSLQFVRSWFRHSFAGRLRRNLQGLLRVTGSSDMLESRLSDGVRSKPWDQLLKVVLDKTLARCESVLIDDQFPTIIPVVDDYRSNVLAQLSTLDDESPGPVRVPSSSRGKRSAKTSKSKMARTQSAVKLQPRQNVVGTSEEMVTAPVRRSGAQKSFSRGQGSSTQSGVGRRTGGSRGVPKL